MALNFQFETLPDAQEKIVVVGVGGGGCNAVNRMIEWQLIQIKQL